ncbi:MAG: zf-HC2 domain-containing protein [Spirochaetaceae bacterium]|jgi:hypothetical protein|nr:zf-HC2 domain-containing protein [Spirochaetaceae bacterium]
MCPDKQILSLYYDGELPEVWGKKMEMHLETCPECRSRLDAYQKTSSALTAEDDGDERQIAVMEAAKDRIWQKLDGENISHKFVRAGRAGIVPRIPAALTAVVAGAAAAAAVIILTLLAAPKQNDSGGFAAAGSPADGFTNVTVSNEYEFNIPEIAPVSNMQELLRYLENDDSSNIIIIKLPERKKFSRYGEPALINAANYTRRGQQK